MPGESTNHLGHRWTQTDISALRDQARAQISPIAIAASLARTEQDTVRMAARLRIKLNVSSLEEPINE